jgi:Activator of Hsp90 ATPase homolog 1-like protein
LEPVPGCFPKAVCGCLTEEKQGEEEVKTSNQTLKKQQDFGLSLTVKASAKETMEKISQVNLWWAKNFNGRARNLQDEFSVYFGDTYVNFRISEFIPDKKITWQVTDCNLHWIVNKKEWKNTEVIWSLAEKSGKTQIDFSHKGVTPESECYESCKPGWTHHLKDSLEKLIETGNGFPE